MAFKSPSHVILHSCKCKVIIQDCKEQLKPAGFSAEGNVTSALLVEWGNNEIMKNNDHRNSTDITMMLVI